MAHGDARKLLGRDVGSPERGELARAEGGVGPVQEVGEGEVERRVAEELEPLVRGGAAGEGLMGERQLKQGAVVEPVLEKPLDSGRRLRSVLHEARRRRAALAGAGLHRCGGLIGVIARTFGAVSGEIGKFRSFWGGIAQAFWGGFAEVFLPFSLRMSIEEKGICEEDGRGCLVRFASSSGRVV